MRGKPGEAGAPGRIVHHVASGDETLSWILVPADDVADADHAIERRLRVEEGSGPGACQRHMRDKAGCHAAAAIERLEPAGLAEAIVVDPARLDMHGGDDVLAARIGKIVLDEVVALDRVDVADRVPLVRREPGVPFQAQVPKMVMRIDDRTVISIPHGAD